MKIALVQDWLTGMRGGEKVLEKLCEMFPDAPLYTMVHIPGSVSKIIENRPIFTSILQKIPFGVRYYRHFLPVLPLLVKSLNLKKYDIVISTSHCVAKNVKAARGGIHICYCHTPMRYIWDMFDNYFSPQKALLIYLFMKFFLPYLRFVDVRTSRNVKYFIANSKTTAERIKRYYKRDSEVIYPPVDVEYYTPANIKREDFYLIVSSLVPYKRVELAIMAFNKNRRKLKIIGSGPELKYLKSIAYGGGHSAKNIKFYNWCGAEKLRENYRRCRALIFPGKEDFGIVPVEAMACGASVIAFGEGGVTETVIDKRTGIFFNRQTADSLNKAIEEFEAGCPPPNEKAEFIRSRAEKFSQDVFIKEIKKFLEEKCRCYL